LKQHLDAADLSYDVVAHPRASTSSRTAQSAHIPGTRLAKSVVLHHELGYVMAVVPSTHRVELGSLQSVLDKRLGLATEGELASLFDDCDVGAVPPIGAAYGIEVVMDESLDHEPEMFFEGGDHMSLIHMQGAAFRNLTRDVRRARFSHHI
jgi:Ala-tRNA(Pro) deacylase